MTHLRSIALPFVVVHPAAARVRTRLRVEAADEDVLRVVGRHLGSLAGEDLAQRCREGKLSAKQRAQSRESASGRSPPRARRAGPERSLARARTPGSSPGAALSPSDGHSPPVSTGSSGGSRSPSASAAAIRPGRSLTRSAGASSTSGRGWRGRTTPRRGRVSICRGGSRLAKARHNLDAAAPERSRLAGAVGGRAPLHLRRRRGRSAPRQPDGPLAPRTSTGSSCASRRPSSTSPIVPVAATGSRARSSSPTAVRRWRHRPRAAPCATTSSSTRASTAGISTPRGRSPTASFARAWSTCARAP